MTNPYRALCAEPLAQEAYVAFVQICKGGSDDAGAYDADEAIVRRALKRLDELEGALLAQPVAVSERLPGPEDCDEQGRCWMCGKVGGDWRLISTINSGIRRLTYCFSHWLPANALPTPEALDD
jgi:hypothetical protein